MSDENPEVGSNGEGQQSEPVNVDQLLEELNQLKSTNERLLNESKDHKSRFQETKAERDRLKEAEIERSNDLNAKIEHYQKVAKEREEELLGLKSEILQGKIRDTYREVAPDCFEPEVVINTPEYAESIKAAIDRESLSVDRDVLKSVYEKDRERRQYLYGNKKLPSMVSDEPKPDIVKAKTGLSEETSSAEAVDYWVKKLQK